MLLLVVYVVASEVALSRRGFTVTVSDTEARWLNERERAAALGKQALILVGASRSQLDFDLDVLRKRTALEPVQLAIDGSSYVPVLQGLARDPEIRGTVVLDLMPGPISFDIGPTGRSQHYQARYDALMSDPLHWPTYREVDAWLAGIVRSGLINYSDEGRPWDALVNRLLNPRAAPQYLVTSPDRSRKADYRQVKMPEFYLSGVHRHLGSPAEIDLSRSADEITQALASYVSKLKPANDQQTAKGLNDLERAISAIQSRGGSVILVTLPTSGFVLEADSRRFPRHLYWDKVMAKTSAQAIHWQDFPGLGGFICPDGSHLDQKDQAAFTEAFVQASSIARR